MIEKRYWIEGVNSDTDPKLFSDKEMLNLMNGRFGVTKSGRAGRIENVPSHQLVTQQVYPPYGAQQTIGSTVDIRRGRIIYANYNTFEDHAIYAYDIASGNTYAVVYDSQVIDGLGFSKSYRINRNMRVIGDLLYWTDNLNRQRKINIERGIRTNHASYDTDYEPYSYPMTQDVISLLKRPPLYPVLIEKLEQTSPALDNNFIKNEAFEFLARYYYSDGETSVMSTYSELANYNASTDVYNCIEIVFQDEEYIDQDVQRVDLIVRYGNTNKFFVIKSWDKDIPEEATEIANHNSGTEPLTYRFFNDKVGEAIDYDGYGYKPFDSVPRYSETLEIATNRLFLGNNIMGYDTPTVTPSLTAEFIEDSEGATVEAQWVSVTYSGGVHYFLDLQTGDVGIDGFYDASPQPPPFPASVTYGSLTRVATGPASFAIYLLTSGLYPGWVGGFPYTGNTSTVTGVDPITLQGAGCFKTDASYQLGIVFYDFGDRKCGVVTSDDFIYTTADRVYGQVTFITGLNWALSNTNAVNEIPDWATHYSVVITKCLRTRFFLQARVKNLTYVTKDGNGAYVFNTSVYSANLNGVGVDITLLNSYGMGYVFSEGDLIKIYKDSAVYTLSIIAQDGRWLVCELQNLGTIGTSAVPYTTALFEIYTPFQPSVNEPFYEVGQTFPVNNPGEAGREYSVISGSFNGDVTLLERSDGANDYFTENMSPNDKFYLNWYTDSGRANFLDRIGETEEPNVISFSNKYINGSRINGLSSFDPLNVKDIPLECGQLQKLQLTSKAQDEIGVTMLGICERQTVSMYLGEVQQYGSNKETTLTVADSVIGTINVLKNTRGIIDSSSVIEYDGLVNFIDIVNGKVVQYSNNGLDDISDYKMQRFFKNYCDEYLATNSNNLDNINGFHHTPSCFDTFHREFIISLPGLIYSNYGDVLPSYGGVAPDYATSILNRFDIADSLAKTMVFKFEDNVWMGDFEPVTEWYDYLYNKTFAFKNGYLYEMYASAVSYNNFFGVQYPVRICCTGNINPSQLKDLFNVIIESNAAPDYSVAMANWPNQQITDLSEDDYTDQQGTFYADWFLDRLSPNASGTADEKMYVGDVLTDKALFFMFEFQQYEQLFYCNFVDIGWGASRGQSNPVKVINT